MGDQSELQPDGCLLILPESGGQTRVNENEYMVGSPEFIAEIASSTESIDLHAKRLDYERAGVREYMVAAVRQRRVFWWTRRGKGKFRPLSPGADGLFRSQLFPGLWLDSKALLAGNLRQLLAVLRQGLATPEHAAFVQMLAGRAAKK
jgi:Uma2 family endonuclease